MTIALRRYPVHLARHWLEATQARKGLDLTSQYSEQEPGTLMEPRNLLHSGRVPQVQVWVRGPRTCSPEYHRV